MICIEDLGNIIPPQAGKIVGIATRRDECIVACEYGLYRLWDDGVSARMTRESPSTGEKQ